MPGTAQLFALKMDPSQFMLLPKGFVTNSEDIYKEVASYPVVPPEKIREYWGGKRAPIWPPAAGVWHRESRLLVSCLLTWYSIYDHVP